MDGRQRTRAPLAWRRVVVMLVAGLALAAIIAVYATTPPLTVLSVHVIDGNTGAPLAGAQVVARLSGQDPLTAVTTGEDGIARFEFFEEQAGYHVQVQKVDYARWSVDDLTIAGEQETVLSVPLVHDPGGRLYVGLEGARVVQVDLASLARIPTIILPVAPESPVRFLRLHPTLDLLYVAAGAQGQILSSLTGATLATFDVQASAIDSLEVSADGRYVLATGLAEFDPTGVAEQRHLWFLSAESGTLVTDTILSRASLPVEVAWQPDGVDTYVLLATSSVVDRVTASNATLGQLRNVAFRARGYPNRVNLSPGGEWLYTWVSTLYSQESAAYHD
ncbi:MAG TPA: carboxypeptidase-like regulatory domain-containing protein, partial [Anaerolineae bacterium]|nr:carboxypeptidase-like regulatory domain-containing protein [Anaerolineae bacterium]